MSESERKDEAFFPCSPYTFTSSMKGGTKMEFSLREETKMLKNNAEKFMKEKCPSSFVKNILKEEKGFSPALCQFLSFLVLRAASLPGFRFEGE